MQVTVAFIVSIFLLGITAGILIAVVVNSIKFSNELNNILDNTKKKENIKNSNSEHRDITKNIREYVIGEAQSPFNGMLFTYYKKDGEYVKSGENILLYI